MYTSLRSRAAPQAVCAPTLLGNIPGRQATTLWWSLQHRIELALQAGQPLTGVTSDLVKAFNFLPREVAFKVASCMGVHPKILKAWASATVHLKRHFVVPQVKSTTGFVERCGLCVVSMVLINTLIHAYLEHRHRQVSFMSYVDNFELESLRVATTDDALQSLKGFWQLLDIEVDQR